MTVSDFNVLLDRYAWMVAYDVGGDPFGYTEEMDRCHSETTQDECRAAVIAAFIEAKGC